MTSDSNVAKNNAHGFLLDGQSPRRQPLTLNIQSDGLSYTLQDGTKDVWKFADTDWSHSPLDRNPLYLKGFKKEDAWLVITDISIEEQIRTTQKVWAKKNLWLVYADQRALVWSFLKILMLVGGLYLLWPLAADRIAASAPDGLRALVNHMGDNYLNEEKQCLSPEAEQALSILQTRLAHGRPQILNLKLIVVDQGMVNAFTLPGNQVVITRGLLAQAQNSDEVAGVLAHEFGHVLNDHILRGFLRSSLQRVVIAALARALGSFPQIADTTISNAYTRGFERDADATALVLLHDSNVSAKGLAEFFKRLESKQKSEGGAMTYLSDHPAPKDRAAMMEAAAKQETSTTDENILTEDQWQALRSVCHIGKR